MQLTPTITFLGMDRSEALESEIRARIDKLETYYQSTMGCRVLVELRSRKITPGSPLARIYQRDRPRLGGRRHGGLVNRMAALL